MEARDVISNKMKLILGILLVLSIIIISMDPITAFPWNDTNWP